MFDHGRDRFIISVHLVKTLLAGAALIAGFAGAVAIARSIAQPVPDRTDEGPACAAHGPADVRTSSIRNDALVHCPAWSMGSTPIQSEAPAIRQEDHVTDAPGWPGIAPRWTSSAKSGVGTALSPVSRVWFTLSHGILNEIYYPRVDQACTRDLGLIVTDDAGFFSEEKRDCTLRDRRGLEDGVPAFQLINTYRRAATASRRRISTDPRADVVLQRIRLAALERIAAPAVRPAGAAPRQCRRAQHGLVGDYKGITCCSPRATAPAWPSPAPPSSPARSASSAPSDGWQQLHARRQPTGVRPRRGRQCRAHRRNR